MTEKMIEAIEELGWQVTEHDDEWLIEAWSPAGEDLPLEIPKDEDIVKWLWENARTFDPDENVELWINHRGKDGVPQTARELVEDADAIAKMYEELAKAAEEAAK